MRALKTTAAQAATNILKAIEPWYHWGIEDTWSLELLSDKSAGLYGDETTGKVGFFTFQWLGFHLHIQIGRTPKRENGK